jgi:hypothetical protein
LPSDRVAQDLLIEVRTNCDGGSFSFEELALPQNWAIINNYEWSKFVMGSLDRRKWIKEEAEKIPIRLSSTYVHGRSCVSHH